jgi:hypothetical protein
MYEKIIRGKIRQSLRGYHSKGNFEFDDNNKTTTLDNEYFTKARNTKTNEPHKYVIGKNQFGETTKIISEEQVLKWCERGPTCESNLPTWVNCRDIQHTNGKWYRVPDEKCHVRKLNLQSDIGFRPDGSLPMYLKTNVVLKSTRKVPQVKTSEGGSKR